MEALIEMHAWTVARPRHETSIATDGVNSKLVKFEQVEKEQGMLFIVFFFMTWLESFTGIISFACYLMFPALSFTCPHSPPTPPFVCSRSLGMDRPRLSLFRICITHKNSPNIIMLTLAYFITEQTRRRLAKFFESMRSAVEALNSIRLP